MRALVTGFEGWAGKVNPSGVIAKELDGREVGTIQVVGRELPEDFDKLPEILGALIREVRPKVIVSTGWDYVSKLKVEKLGLNVQDSTFYDAVVPDNYGNTPAGREVVPKGVVALWATLPAEKIVGRLNQVGVPAYISYHAGTHCCNTVMYSSLYHVRDAGLSSLTGFIHVPPIAEMSVNREGVTPMKLEDEMRAISLALDTCVETLQTRPTRSSKPIAKH